MNEATPLLTPEHWRMLTVESAISKEVIAARGYRSIPEKGGKAELRRLGFGDSQSIVPTLLVPIWNVNGEIALYHHRPENPRYDTKEKRVNKYEFPTGKHMVLDVHPFLKEKIRDPKIDLFITEGVKKADSAISRGLCCMGVVGTWNWRGTNEFGGKTALPDWEYVALKDSKNHGRQVYICYDSDVMLKQQVYAALLRLSEFLKSRGARVAYIYLPYQEAKV